ncbi:copper resistance protein CopC [Streptosporangium sp. NPDC002721]|uniref:copper resistance protein CopC n=1 Tax=Streptosporangium sp. NPDC002721 TaxID=3366188 RepID=UPI0036B9FDD1
MAVLLLAALLVLLLPGTAEAHAVLKSTDPRDGQVLAQAPRTVTATFNEAITLAPKGNQLLDPAGRVVPADIRSVNDTVVYTPASTLAEGTYIVSWRVVSADTHPVGGGISFSVGRPSASSVAVPDQVAGREVNVLRIGAEVLRYGGVLGFAGLTAFVLFVAEPSVRRSAAFARRVRRARDALAAAALLGAVALVPLVKLWQDGAGVGELFSASLWPAALSAAPAAAAALLAAGTVLALVAMRRDLPVAAAPVAATPSPSAGPRTLTAAVGGNKATMVISPGRRGVNALQLSLVDGEGVPLVPHETPQLSVRLPVYELGPFKKPLSTTGKGTYEATVDFPLDGTWTVTLVVRLSEFESPVVSQKVVIP